MFFLDRVEEGLAIIFKDDVEFLKIDAKNIKGNVRDGIVLSFDGQNWEVDEVESKKRAEKAQSRLNRLFNKNWKVDKKMEKNVYELARELATAVLETKEGQKVSEARFIFDNNEEARQQLLDYNIYKDAVNSRIEEGQLSREEMQKEGGKMAQMVDELKKNPIINDMVKAEAEFNMLVNRVIGIFQASLTGEDENEDGCGCSGGCGSCSGCH